MSYHGWDKVDLFTLNETIDLILTGHNMSNVYCDLFYFPILQNKDEPLKILDFGCGVGRNSIGLVQHSPLWRVLGFDNPAMINRADEYISLKYPDFSQEQKSRLAFSSDWKNVRLMKFDVIFATLVFQHIREPDLTSYMQDFKSMSPRVFVAGRRFNDDDNKNTWKMMLDCGYKVVRCWKNGRETQFSLEGPPEEHFACMLEPV